MFILAIVLSPKLAALKIAPRARYSFAAMMVLMGTYIGWISKLFFEDQLGPINYVPELWAVRILLLLALLHFLHAAYKCKP
jgi:hypothetical protein